MNKPARSLTKLRAKLTQGCRQSVNFAVSWMPIRRQDSIASDVVVSLTSYPARFHTTVAAIRSVLRQQTRPAKIVLVLARDETDPSALPRGLRRLQDKFGLEILWIDRGMGPFGKLLPTARQYPSYRIVTVDDDCVYAPSLIDDLVMASNESPGAIIGTRGYDVLWEAEVPRMYSSWAISTPATCHRDTFLTGVGGVLYPPEFNSLPLMFDYPLAQRLSPRNDDVWYWAVARVAGIERHSLEKPSFQSAPKLLRRGGLWKTNVAEDHNDFQIGAVVRHFNLAPPSSGANC